jgi:hypothetical protein
MVAVFQLYFEGLGLVVVMIIFFNLDRNNELDLD